MMAISLFSLEDHTFLFWFLFPPRASSTLAEPSLPCYPASVPFAQPLFLPLCCRFGIGHSSPIIVLLPWYRPLTLYLCSTYVLLPS
ncbi:unnamed protein product [Prunus armeniaca]